MPSKSKADKDLTQLLTVLYTIQEDVGAVPKTTKEDKASKAENIAAASSMGTGKKTAAKGSRFLVLKSSIIEKLREVHAMLAEQAEREAGRVSVAAGNNPKDIITKQAAVREHIRQLQEEWRELDGLYKNEARKKRSKFTQVELETQHTLVLNLQSEIEKVREIQQRGYVRGAGESTDVATQLNTKALAALDATTLMASGNGGGGAWEANDVQMTDNQRTQVQALEDRDQDFDRQLDEIGEGIQDLHEIAQMQGEEVRRQNMMLDNMGKRIDAVHEQVVSVNIKMKDTLTEVGRASDKLCVDIVCILFAVGFGAVFYQVSRMYDLI
jgi:uncharacterized coiled-coil DUF342 family protein